MAYGALRKPQWTWLAVIERLSGHHWSWLATIVLGVLPLLPSVRSYI